LNINEELDFAAIQNEALGMYSRLLKFTH
jgi:hypothetical protein